MVLSIPDDRFKHNLLLTLYVFVNMLYEVQTEYLRQFSFRVDTQVTKVLHDEQLQRYVPFLLKPVVQLQHDLGELLTLTR